MKAKTLKSKINTAQKTKKLTKAMENISSIKMNKYYKQLNTLNTYHNLCTNIMNSLSLNSQMESKYVNRNNLDLTFPEYLDKELIIVITSDKGLCGAYNYKIVSEFNNYIKNSTSKPDVMCIGKKGANTVVNKDLKLLGLYLNVDRENISDVVLDLVKFINQKYLEGAYAKVTVIYTAYISGQVQKVQIQQLLPIALNVGITEGYELIEQDITSLMDSLCIDLIKTNITKYLLESITCENVARANSMKNATDSANSLIEDLTIMYNKSRQAMVTQEIMEISNGASGNIL